MDQKQWWEKWLFKEVKFLHWSKVSATAVLQMLSVKLWGQRRTLCVLDTDTIMTPQSICPVIDVYLGHVPTLDP